MIKMQNKNFFVSILFILALSIAACEQAIRDGTIKEITNFDDCAKAGYPVYFSEPPFCETPDGRAFTKNITINSFEDCAKAGNPIMESYPRQCKTPDGKSFVEKIDTTQKQIEIEGEIACLPSKRGTEECAYGLKSDEGNYYSLQNLNQQDLIDGLVTTGMRVKVDGKLTPPSENLLASYGVVGQIDIDTVTHISPLLKKIPTRGGDLRLKYEKGVTTLSGILTRSTPCVHWTVEIKTEDSPISQVTIDIFNSNKGAICIQVLGEPQEIYEEINSVSEETEYTIKIEQEVVFEGKLNE